MSTQKLSNVSLAEFRRFLQNAGCHQHRVKGGHGHWVKPGLTRPITFQTHIDPVPGIHHQECLTDVGRVAGRFLRMLA